MPVVGHLESKRQIRRCLERFPWHVIARLVSPLIFDSLFFFCSVLCLFGHILIDRRAELGLPDRFLRLKSPIRLNRVKILHLNHSLSRTIFSFRFLNPYYAIDPSISTENTSRPYVARANSYRTFKHRRSLPHFSSHFSILNQNLELRITRRPVTNIPSGG